MPHQPLMFWDITEAFDGICTLSPIIPIIYGDDPSKGSLFKMKQNQIYLGLDVFGSAFFMLTRYEEIVKTERDEHGRFLSENSIAYQEGFLDRPIIDEYIEILWWSLKKLSPSLKRRRTHFRFIRSRRQGVVF